MEYLLALKGLQENYQQKFAAFLKLQEESSTKGNDSIHLSNCAVAKQEWIKAGDELKAFLEENK
jgi:hypothetical protein